MSRTKTYLFLILNLLLTCSLFAQTEFRQLSQSEKLEDFNYLYKELEAAYPYFGINKRVFKTDWLANKDKYINSIKETTDNKSFFKVFNGILNDLNNGHTDAYPTIIYSYFYDAYQYGVSQDSMYLIYVKELEKSDTLRTAYWKEINRALFFPELEKDAAETNEPQEEEVKPDNVETWFVDSLSTAIIHVRSFSYDYVEEDAEILQRFFDTVYNYKNLIIDIQGNDGGSTEYWMENMIPYMIDEAISYPLVYGFKNCERLKKFKPYYFENTIPYEAIGLPNMPEELKGGSYLFRKDSITIDPITDNKGYSGKTYLLVDNEVYSSSEALAYFCKATNFATVAGEKTSGDGVGTDPLLLTLPNSGIVIRFTGEMGLNPDGSANDETKTVPDLIIKAANKKERRGKLLNYIKHNQ